MTTQSLDQLLSVLAVPERRLVCRYVAATDDVAVPVDDLITALADGSPPPTDDRRSRIATGLFHVHLPALDDAAIVDYDATRGPKGSVTAGTAFSDAIELLRRLEDGADEPADAPTLE